MRKTSFLLLLLLFSTQVWAQRPTWAVNETLFENTQTMIAKLSLDGKALESPNDMVGAFVGNECRGVASPVFIPATGKYYTYLTVFSNKQGEEIVFKLYESASGRIVPVDKKLSFNINGHIGSFFQAYSISMPTLSNLATISNFELYNVRPDSVVTKGDVRTYYIPANVAKDTLTTNFSVSAGAKVYVKEVPVVAKVTKVNFTNPVTFQVVSQDESTLLNYKVEVKNSFTTDCSKLTIAKPTVSNVNYCLNVRTGVLSVTATAGKSLVWYGNNQTGGTGSTSAPTPSSSAVGQFNYYVVQKDTLSGCESERAKIVVTVSDYPALPKIANLNYCQSTDTPSLSAEPIATARLLWYGKNETGGTASLVAPVVEYSLGSLVNYYVSQRDTLTGCESARAKIDVKSLATSAPVKPTVTDVQYCQNTTTTGLKASNLPGTRILWYGLNATGGVGTFVTPVPSSNSVGEFSYYVAQQDTSSGCASDRAKLVVTIKALPAKPTIVLDASYNLVSNASTGNQWYKEGAIVAGATAATFKPSSNGTYSVKVTSGGCSSDMSANFNYLITAMSSLAKEEFVTLSPNPFTDELRINYYLVNSTTASISVLDLSGRMVIENKEIGPESSLHLRDLPAGIYVVRLLDSDGRLLYTQKIVKN